MSGHKVTVARETHGGDSAAVRRRRLILVVIAFLAWAWVSFFCQLDCSQLAGDMQPAQVQAGLALLVLAAILWLTEALPLAMTAILIPVMASLTGVLEVSASFANFAHPLIFLFLGGFGLAAALSRQKLDQWLAQQIVCVSGGRFYLTFVMICVASAALSMWISNTATVALLLPVVLGLLSKVELAQGEKVAARVAPCLLLGLCYSASVGGIGTLIGSPPNAIAATELGIDFVSWLKFGIPAVLILLPLMLLVLTCLVHPGKVTKLDVDCLPFDFNGERIATLGVFALAVTGWLFSQSLASWLGIVKYFDTLVAVSAVLILTMGRLVRWKDIDHTTDWGVLLLFGGGLTLSKVLSETKASLFLAHQLRETIESWPYLALIAVVIIFVIFLTEVSSNTATAALLVPVFAAVAADMGLAPKQLVVPLAMAASCAFMLPVATPPNAIVFSSGKIRQRTMMRTGLVLNLLFVVLLTALSWLIF